MSPPALKCSSSRMTASFCIPTELPKSSIPAERCWASKVSRKSSAVPRLCLPTKLNRAFSTAWLRGVRDRRPTTFLSCWCTFAETDEFNTRRMYDTQTHRGSCCFRFTLCRDGDLYWDRARDPRACKGRPADRSHGRQTECQRHTEG